MKSAPVWIEDARRMLAEGLNAETIAKRVGANGETVRRHLDINGAAERYRLKLDRYRREGKYLSIARSVTRDAHVIAPAPLAPAKVSVPFVSILVGVMDRPYQMKAVRL